VPRSLSKSRSNILGVRRLDAEAASSSIDETIFGLNAIELHFCGLTINASGCFFGGADFPSQINDSKNWLAGVLWVS
jgi:hypothetical protein